MLTKLGSVVLYSPEIPGNTGSIGRTCIALGMRLILIHPLGFEITEKAVRRAGLDYWKDVDLVEYQNWEEFLKHEEPVASSMYFLESQQGQNFIGEELSHASYFIFGGETKSLPQTLLNNYSHRLFHLPMESNKVRSLNLSNTVAAVCYLALAQKV
jgi:tRNA (cytidine/uridine-2'-O-)-methyltransferase